MMQRRSLFRPNPAVLFILLYMVMTALMVRPTIAGKDGKGNYSYLLSMMTDGDLNFADDYALIDSTEEKHYKMSAAPISENTGLPANRFGPGAALMWAPMTLCVHAYMCAFEPSRATGLTLPYRWSVALSTALWAGLALLFLFRRISSICGPFRAAMVIVAMTFATSLFFYIWIHPSMSHGVSFFAMTMAVLALEEALLKKAALSVLKVGFWSGLLVVIRTQNASWPIVIGFGILLMWDTRRGKLAQSREDNELRSRWIAFALFTIGAFVAFFPQWWTWKVLYGSWWSGPLPYLGREGGSWNPIPSHLISVLFSERGGVLAWHPLLLVGLLGLPWKTRTLHRPLMMLLLIGLGLQVYVVSGWSMWWAGHSFGNRFFISCYPVLALGLTAIVAEIRSKKILRTCQLSVLLLIFWNGGLAIQYGTNMIPRGDEVGWAVVIKNQVTRVPAWIFDQF